MVDISYELQDKQLIAFDTTATEVLFGGSCGSGKSYLMRVASIIWALEIPGIQIFLFRRLYSDLYTNHIVGPGGYVDLLATLVDEKVCRIIGDEKIKFENSSMIHLCHCQYERDVIKYQGSEIHVLMIDELTHFTESIYRFLRNRLRIGGLQVPKKYSGLFPRILCGTNPGGVGHSWVKQEFIDSAAPFEIHEVSEESGGMLRQFIPALLSDNKVLCENDPDYEKRLAGLGDPELVRAMRYGDWDIAQGAFFGAVWDAKKLVIPSFDFENVTWRCDRSYDWGLAKPSAVCWFLQSDGSSITYNDPKEPDEIKEFWMPKGSLIMFDEYYTCTRKNNEGNGELARQTAQYIKEKEDKWKFMVNPGPADTAIYKTEYNDGNIAADMRDEGITWTRADKSAGSRANGWAKMAGMMFNACNRDLERPWLVFMDKCKHTIRTLPMLPRDASKAEDIDSNSEDHLADAIRYRVGKPNTRVYTGKVGGL